MFCVGLPANIIRQITQGVVTLDGDLHIGLFFRAVTFSVDALGEKVF